MDESLKAAFVNELGDLLAVAEEEDGLPEFIGALVLALSYCALFHSTDPAAAALTIADDLGSRVGAQLDLAAHREQLH